MKPRHVTLLFATGLLLVTTAVSAAPKIKPTTYFCAIHHYVRDGGAELRTAGISIRNSDLANAAVIERVTVRNVFGDVVHDSGPAAGTAHPLNTDFASPLDITTVPPGANYYLSTRHLWGLDGLPVTAGGNQAGFLLSAILVIAKADPSVPVFVGRRDTVRERLPTIPPVEGAERSSNAAACARID